MDWQRRRWHPSLGVAAAPDHIDFFDNQEKAMAEQDEKSWKVREGYQVSFGGKLHGPGDSVRASEAQLRAEGIGPHLFEEGPEAGGANRLKYDPSETTAREAMEAEEEGTDGKRQTRAQNKAVGQPEPGAAESKKG